MTLYALSLFIHVSAVLVLFAALSVEVLFLYRLRRASTLTEALVWVDPVPGLPLIVASSGLVTLFSGAYLAMRMSAFGLAWPKVAVAALVLMVPLGAVTGRRMRAIRQACTNATAISGELLSRLQDQFLKISLCMRVSIFLSVVLLMGAKPNLWNSITTVGIFLLLGALFSLPGFPLVSLSAPRTDLGRQVNGISKTQEN